MGNVITQSGMSALVPAGSSQDIRSADIPSRLLCRLRRDLMRKEIGRTFWLPICLLGHSCQRHRALAASSREMKRSM